MTLLVAILLWLLILSILASIFRRTPWLPGAFVGIGLILLIGQLWQLPTEGTAELLGRALDLDKTNSLFAFTLSFDLPARGIAILLFFWGALFALASAWSRADRVLYPAIPLILAALVLALSSAPLLWAPIWLIFAAILMAFPAQGASPRLARAALRTLIAPTLALPFFLFTAWVLAQPTVAADDPALWANAWRALVIGIALLLTPVPLHGWITAQGENAPPFAAAFLVGVWQITIYALVRHILLEYPTLAEFAEPAQWLPWIAICQLAWAGLFGLGSNRLGQLWGYLLLWDFGAAFLLWSASGEFGAQAMVGLFVVRPLVLILIAASLKVFNERFGENAAYDLVGGAGQRLPVATLGLVGGGLFLLGWPLGALFPVRLTTLRLVEVSQGGPLIAYGLVFVWAMIALFLMTLGLIRTLRALNHPLADPALPREPARIGWLVLPLLITGFILSLNPGLLNPVTAQIADWLTQF